MFSTDSGKKVLAYLKAIYVDASALNTSPEVTFYNLGKKELVQGLLSNCTQIDTLHEYVLKDNVSVYSDNLEEV